MEEKYLYVIFSSIPNKIGKLIRTLTRYPYNHLSISLDPELKSMYSFARRYYSTPFYGGFVHESISRYHIRTKQSQVKLFRIPITLEQFNSLSRKLQTMLENNEHYIYNHLSAITSIIHKNIKLTDAYMCIEFVVEILHSIGIQIDPKAYYSIRDLEKILHKFAIYTGPIPETDMYDATFYTRKPLPHPWLATIVAFIEQFQRFD